MSPQPNIITGGIDADKTDEINLDDADFSDLLTDDDFPPYPDPQRSLDFEDGEPMIDRALIQEAIEEGIAKGLSVHEIVRTIHEWVCPFPVCICYASACGHHDPSMNACGSQAAWNRCGIKITEDLP